MTCDVQHQVCSYCLPQALKPSPSPRNSETPAPFACNALVSEYCDLLCKFYLPTLSTLLLKHRHSVTYSKILPLLLLLPPLQPPPQAAEVPLHLH